MTTYPAWTPASRPGIVPLHPYGFGTILGRSFTALRQNPRVLLGFALLVQAVAYVVLVVATGGVAAASFSRLDTVPPGDDYDAILIGSVTITAATGIVLSLAAGVLTVLVQGVVVAEVAHAVVAEKPTLGAVWRRVRPVVWRLIGYSALLLIVTTVLLAAAAAVVFGLGVLALPAGIGVGVLLVLGAIPLYLWLSTKLFLVPSVIILERQKVFAAIGRSWRLTRTRFWPTLGVIVIISLAFSVVAQVISFPLSLLGSAMSVIISPTGDAEVGGIITLIVTQLIGQIGVLLVQCVALVVQSTSAALVYVDARMRHEGLDHDLLTYVEARDGGSDDLADPYLVGVGRPAPAPRYAPAYAAPSYPPPPYGAPLPGGPVPAGAPTGAAYPGPPPSSPPYASVPAPGGYAPPPAGDRVDAPTGAPATPDTPRPSPTASTTWAAPGAGDGDGGA